MPSGLTLQARIERAIETATGETTRSVESRPVAGGCINDARLVTLDNGRTVFVKSNSNTAGDDVFACEYQALRLLAVPNAVRVTKPIAFDDDFIVIEAFREGTAARNWQELMGRQLAQLHRATRCNRFGFDRQGYLGSSRQPNGWSTDWVSFWREQRLGWQLKLLADSGHSDDRLLTLGNKLMDRLDPLLSEPAEPAVLLHGDLWSGNAAADESGQPIIFDPASYYGRREAEIGMMRLFGGFDSRCEAAYQEIWPLAEGADQRIACYRLYHELNHLNSFGGAYYQACLATLTQLT